MSWPDDPDITFDENGICNHCHEYEMRASLEVFYCCVLGQLRLEGVIEQMKLDGDGKPYDCVIGLSGGLDSSFAAYHIVKMGLRPLALSLDNGWDTEIAKENISNLVTKLNIDWEHHSLDPKQYKDLQLSFLKSGVINIEAPTDHAITSFLYKRAAQEGLRYIVHGGNIVTEAIMPRAWGYDAKDWRHIKAIHKKFGSASLRGFPHMTLWHWTYYTFCKGIKWFPILNYVEYVPAKAKQILSEAVGWKDYGGKHLESEWTAFFQQYILPMKFGIDKRKAHLSTLINSGFMTREEALSELAKEPDISMRQVEAICRKLGISVIEFHVLMNKKPIAHSQYESNERWFKYFGSFVKYAKKVATQSV